MWMIEVVRKYLNKNLFYISVIITGFTSLLFGVFYNLFKDNMFERAASDFLEGTGVLSAYITESTGRPSETNYFVIILLISICFFFIISLLMHLYTKKSYFKIFNLLSILNIVLIIGLALSSIFISVSVIFTYVILILCFGFYLFGLYQCLDKIFNLDKKKRIISMAIFVIPVILILILLKLFV